ncbi:MAG: KH domain-containing protein [Candidatus Peribacteria bacterium]|nr:MAG: KH domain-containing protein [Candidatus Peribacteria bacterium]
MKEVEFLQYVVENLVNHPGDIQIERTEDELGTLLTLRVNKEDMGIIIGKSGNTINALRSVLRLLGMKLDKKLNLKVLD